MGALQDNVALVTGASRGLGRGIALEFAADGADVVVTARKTEALEALVDEIQALGRRALAVTADLSVQEDIDRIVESGTAEFGRIDILVNNAALIHDPVDLIDFEPEFWRYVIDVNLNAPALLTRAVLPGMIERRFGKVINISSMGARYGGPARTAYRAAKAAMINLTESVAAEVKQYGVDVNCICPGAVLTEGWEEVYGHRDDLRPYAMEPVQIAKLAVFLATDASAAVTGAAIDAWGPSNPIFRH
jgi:3-oxoacyl-[acyl-carrier protein] reductase